MAALLAAGERMGVVTVSSGERVRTTGVRQVGRFNPENARELTKRLKEDEGLRREAAERIEEDPATFVASAFDLTERQLAHLRRSFSRDDAEGLTEAYLEVLESGGEVDLKIERPKDRVSYREARMTFSTTRSGGTTDLEIRVVKL
jgi:hypothetical protein